MTYEQRVDRSHPALVIFLVDQSESMSAALWGTGSSKAQAVADQLNTLIYDLVLRSTKSPTKPPQPYFFVGVIGYSTDPKRAEDAGPPLGLLSITYLAQNPLRVDRVAGRLPGQTVASPVWLEPHSAGGTPMCSALDRAGRICKRWVQDHPETFPPIILNITDGDSTDGDPSVWAGRLRSLGCRDGKVLLFNINLSEEPGTPLLFPKDARACPTPSAERLFQMSSLLPRRMVARGHSQGVPVQMGSRGFAYNADWRTLTGFLDIGTSILRTQL